MREIHTIRGEASTDHPLRGRVELTLKFDELSGPSMTFEVVLLK